MELECFRYLMSRKKIFYGLVFLALPIYRAIADISAFGSQSPIPELYADITNGGFTGVAVPESPDPLVGYQWVNPQPTDTLQLYFLKPKVVSADQPGAFGNLTSLTGNNPDVTVRGEGSIRLDFGRENAAWFEFDSPDCQGGVEMSISEYNEPGMEKTGVPAKHGHTYRLELNSELYDGMRFAWIHVKTNRQPWHITGIRAVCQVKPTNYRGSFSCNDPLINRIWYASAYTVKVAMCQNYFGSILMDRGDRISWTGDAHPAQAAALVAFGNYDFIRQNLDNTSRQSDGIKSYSLYWILSLLDYYHYTGDAATLEKYIANSCEKLNSAYNHFGKAPKLKFYGLDERLCAGFEIWFRSCAEAQSAYEMLSIRAWREFAIAMANLGRKDLQEKYDRYANEKMAELRSNPHWFSDFGLHAAADATTTGLLSGTEQAMLWQKEFNNRVSRLSFSPFNQYFVIQAMARMGQYDAALSSLKDLWGGMIKYGGTTTFEVYRPSWNAVIGPNDAVPNSQCGIVSLCHPWGAGPVKWLNEIVLGIVPTTPGFNTYDILPHLGRTVTHVTGTTPTPLGEIRASINVSSGEAAFFTPPGSIGRIGLPKVEKTVTRIFVNGKIIWDGMFHPVPGIGGALQDSEFVYLTSVQPGEYSVSVKYRGKTPRYQETPEIYAAKFIGQDAITRGNWGGVYGKDGYVLCDYSGNGGDLTSLPPYVDSVEFFRAFPDAGRPDNTMWTNETTDCRALAADSQNRLPRKAACISNSDQTMTATIRLGIPRDYQVAFYFVDWNHQGMRQAIEMFDAKTLALVAPVKLVNDFAGGKYFVYSYNKSAKFRFNKVRGARVTLSGIFFDSKVGIRKP